MEERMAQNRLAILQATRDLTARGGFKDAQINAIAELAGISSGLVYRYFNSKNQLLVEVLTDAAMQEIRILESIYREDLPPKEKLFKAVTPDRSWLIHSSSNRSMWLSKLSVYGLSS